MFLESIIWNNCPEIHQSQICFLDMEFFRWNATGTSKCNGDEHWDLERPGVVGVGQGTLAPCHSPRSPYIEARSFLGIQFEKPCPRCLVMRPCPLHSLLVMSWTSMLLCSAVSCAWNVVSSDICRAHSLSSFTSCEISPSHEASPDPTTWVPLTLLTLSYLFSHSI